MTGELGLSEKADQQFGVTKAEKLGEPIIKGDSEKSSCDPECGSKGTSSEVCERKHSNIKADQLVTRQRRGGQATDFKKNFF